MTTIAHLQSAIDQSKASGNTVLPRIYRSDLDEVVDALIELAGEDIAWTATEKGKNAKFGWTLIAQEKANDPAWRLNVTITR
jgi:hypothetical protein